ncbi:MAG: matrixin family metalloprotease, partial [Hyphomicrobiales bacterium]
MRGLKLALVLAATTALAPMMATAEPLTAADERAIFRIIDLKGSKVKWGNPEMGTGTAITYAFATEPVAFAEARNCRAMEPMDTLLARSGIDQALYEAETAKAFDAWSSVADVEFRQIGDTEAADILIGAQSKPVGRAFTNVSYTRAATRAVRPLEKSLICLNPEQPWKVGFDGDLNVYDLRYTLTHEIGHAIGLDHPGTPTQVMSYRYEERFATLQPGDIRGAV